MFITPGTNIAALMAQNAHQRNLIALGGVMERLSTGLRINRGGDDPSGLIISERLRGLLAEIEAETEAAERADHVIATADGALGAMSELLVEAEGLLVANANTAGLSDVEREANQLALNSILGAVNRIAGSTSFNGQALFDGEMTLSVGGRSIIIEPIHAQDIDILADDLAAAQNSLHQLRDDVTTQRGQLGAFSAHTIRPYIDSRSVAFENISAANSIIRDADFALETANLWRSMTLVNATLMTMMAANSNGRDVLRLIG